MFAARGAANGLDGKARGLSALVALGRVEDHSRPFSCFPGIALQAAALWNRVSARGILVIVLYMCFIHFYESNSSAECRGRCRGRCV